MRYWLAALAIAGCIYESGGSRTQGSGGSGGIITGSGGSGGAPGDGGVNIGFIDLSWIVVDQNTGQNVGCQLGETVLVQVGNFIQNFPCTDMGEQLGPIPVGTYSIRASLLDSSRTVEAVATIDNVTVPLNSVTNAGTAVFMVARMPTGVRFSWEIRVGSAAGPARGCNPGETAYFDFGGFASGHPCINLGAEIDGVMPGGYSVVPSLLNSGGGAENTAGPINVNITPGMITDGGHIVFVVPM